MVFLSPRVAVLACLCAALPLALPPRVEAAHVYGLHAMEKRTSSPPGHHPPSGSSTRGHDGKHHGDKAPLQRDPELPPLLRRHSVHAPMIAHTRPRHGWDPRVDAGIEAPRSAFARSRYRRGPDALSRRSSVYVSGEHGDKYLVSWGDGRAGADPQSPHANDRRQLEVSNMAMGRIDIIAAGQTSNSTQRLGSLIIDATAIDWKSDQSTSKAFQLNASTTNRTQFIMTPTDKTPNGAGSFEKHVTLATEVFDANSAEMVMFCATYDPDPGPGSMSTILMTPCTGQTRAAALAKDAGDPCSVAQDASSSNPHQSQIFTYDPVSGKVQPISAATTSPGAGGIADASCAGARVRRDTASSTTTSTSGSTIPSSTSASAPPAPSAPQQARNVTLVYVADALEVPASSSSPNNTAPTSSPNAGQAAVVTTTLTTTVVTTVTAPDPTATPARAAASVSASSASSSSAPPAPTPTTSATPSRSSSSPSSRPAAVANESLAVEVVGVPVSGGGSSSSTSGATSSTSATSSSSSGTPSPSQNQGAASSVVNAAATPGLGRTPISPRRSIYAV